MRSLLREKDTRLTHPPALPPVSPEGTLDGSKIKPTGETRDLSWGIGLLIPGHGVRVENRRWSGSKGGKGVWSRALRGGLGSLPFKDKKNFDNKTVGTVSPNFLS